MPLSAPAKPGRFFTPILLPFGMDRALWTQHLAQAEAHIAQGERHIARQLDLIREMEERGHDVTEARRLLAQFQDTQRIHVADRDRLLKDLAGE